MGWWKGSQDSRFGIQDSGGLQKNPVHSKIENMLIPTTIELLIQTKDGKVEKSAY